jgi:hypothetical protein
MRYISFQRRPASLSFLCASSYDEESTRPKRGTNRAALRLLDLGSEVDGVASVSVEAHGRMAMREQLVRVDGRADTCHPHV